MKRRKLKGRETQLHKGLISEEQSFWNKRFLGFGTKIWCLWAVVGIIALLALAFGTNDTWETKNPSLPTEQPVQNLVEQTINTTEIFSPLTDFPGKYTHIVLGVIIGLFIWKAFKMLTF